MFHWASLETSQSMVVNYLVPGRAPSGELEPNTTRRKPNPHKRTCENTTADAEQTAPNCIKVSLFTSFGHQSMYIILVGN